MTCSVSHRATSRAGSSRARSGSRRRGAPARTEAPAMPDISLLTYIAKARESGAGVIRLDSGTGSKLVNKGSLSGRVGTLLGQGNQETRSERERRALEGF